MTMTNEMTGNKKCWHVVNLDGKKFFAGSTRAQALVLARELGREFRACLDGYHFLPCPGEAHDNPHIDNCSVCAPRWGVVMVPESCATIEAAKEAGAL